MDALPSKLLKSDAATSSLVPLVRRTTLETLHAFATDSRAGEAGGAGRDRTDDPLLAKQVLSQLSYSPAYAWWVWMDSNHRPPPYQDGALTN